MDCGDTAANWCRVDLDCSMDLLRDYRQVYTVLGEYVAGFVADYDLFYVCLYVWECYLGLVVGGDEE